MGMGHNEHLFDEHDLAQITKRSVASVRYLPSDLEAWLGSLPSRGRRHEMPASARRPE
jgi:hypothetical protein